MNDFTKDELEDLLCWLDATRKQDITLPSGKEKTYLIAILQYTMDNYCVHEWTYEETRGRRVCSKCGLSVWVHTPISIPEEITDALATKLRLKQGDL